MIEAELRGIAANLGSFPSSSELRELRRNDLACAVSKSGGFLQWSDRIGVPRKFSDSDFGWAGEVAFCDLCAAENLNAERSSGLRWPWDLIIGGALRCDVKSANYAEYGACRGWFYRVAKSPQADLIVLYQADTGDFFAIPWWVCPTTNVTISRDGGKYAAFKNDWSLVKRMLGVRLAEQAQVSNQPVAEVA